MVTPCPPSGPEIHPRPKFEPLATTSALKADVQKVEADRQSLTQRRLGALTSSYSLNSLSSIGQCACPSAQFASNSTNAASSICRSAIFPRTSLR